MDCTEMKIKEGILMALRLADGNPRIITNDYFISNRLLGTSYELFLYTLLFFSPDLFTKFIVMFMRLMIYHYSAVNKICMSS